MRIAFFFLISALAIFCSACSSVPVVQSTRQTTPIVVDGHASDWPQPLDYYNKEAKLSFSISNDSSKLCFCIQASDAEIERKICRAGLQIWIDTTGGKGKDIGVLYPVASTLARFQPNRNYGSENSSVPEEEFDPIGSIRRNFFRSQANQIQITGFHPPVDGLVPLTNAFNIEIRIDWDTLNNVLNYEGAIPFAAFYHRLTPQDSTTIFGITFTVNGITRGENGQKHSEEAGGGMAGNGSNGTGAYPGGMGGVGDAGAPGGMGGMGGYGGGGMRGGGHRGGGSRDGSSGSSELSEPSSMSFKLKLAR